MGPVLCLSRIRGEGSRGREFVPPGDLYPSRTWMMHGFLRRGSAVDRLYGTEWHWSSLYLKGSPCPSLERLSHFISPCHHDEPSAFSPLRRFACLHRRKICDSKKLSLADRAFTQSCQKYIFRDLKLWNISKISQLTELKKDFGRQAGIRQPSPRAWACPRPKRLHGTFVSILQLFANSPVSPHELYLGGPRAIPLIFEDPILVVRQLAQSSQTLTILPLDYMNVPLPLYLPCPRLRYLGLDLVTAAEKSYDRYPDNQCFSREAPQLEVLDYRNSHSIHRREEIAWKNYISLVYI